MVKKKASGILTSDKINLIEKDNAKISISQQCDLLSLSKSALYYKSVGRNAFNLKLMALIDKQYLNTPFYGTRRMTVFLRTEGYLVGRKRVRRLMRLMNIQAVYPKPNLSKKRQDHKIYPYLLNGIKINQPIIVWSSDITYIPLKHGFVYLVTVIDLYSRYVLSWQLSNTLDALFV